MTEIIKYFSKKHILTNFLVIAVFIGAILFWNKTGKEDMPNITFDFVSIRAAYPGATALEVEYFITKEIEEALEGIDGIKDINSTTSQGNCSVRIELEPNNPNKKNVADEIKDAMNSLRLPDDVENEPRVRQFKSSKRAIIDLMLTYNDVDIMDRDQRLYIQSLVDTIENKLLSLNSVSEVGISGYLNDFIEIQVIPKKLMNYNISLSDIISAINKNNIKQPVGNLSDENSTKIRLDAELTDIESIKNVIIQASFEGNKLYLKDLAHVVQKFEDQSRIQKVNGSEAIRINVTKTSSAGILDAIDQIKALVDNFKNTALKDSPVNLIIMDDESKDIRNRLSLIFLNGLFGFILIIIILFVFLDAKSGLWVAIGIPFTFGFTMIFASLLGHTINNITLAAIIIVMGMVVDDAIVVAENVSRLLSMGIKPGEAVVKGTAAVFLPITASITTTCVAFIPLYFFEGRFGMMIKYIPPIIFLMLGASLFEALFILPSHLGYKFPKWLRNVYSFGFLPLLEKHYMKNKNNNTFVPERKIHWFMKVEHAYGYFLKFILKHKKFLFIIFIIPFIYSAWIFTTKMKFSMFPREETTEIYLSGAAPKGTLKYETERMIREVEDVFIPYLGKEVIGFETSIARSRRANAARENVFSVNIEIVPKDKRKKSSNKLIEEWEKKLENLKGFDYIRFSKARFGQSSGSAIDIVVKENDDKKRMAVAQEILHYLKTIPAIHNPEIETQLTAPEYRIQINRELTNKLGISADIIGSNLRTILEGRNLYDITHAGKDMQVMLTIPSESKADINSLMNLPIENSRGYLVPLKNIATAKKLATPNSIIRLNGKRSIHVYGELTESTKDNKRKLNNNKPSKDIKKKIEQAKSGNKEAQKKNLPVEMTPIEIAEYLEQNIFPEILKKYPTTLLSFAGEIADTREATGNFKFAIILAILLIYIILALTLNSLIKPFIIMLSIPFGCVGVILTLQLHGMLVYGFFSTIGILGLTGVVVNDSIVLLAKLEKEYKNNDYGTTVLEKIANISKTRLRAVLLTTITTVAGLLPTAYGIFGYDSMLAEMMLTMAWGLIFGTLITLVLVPSLYCALKEISIRFKHRVIK